MKQIVLAWLLMVPLLQAATIRVPQDQATIQAGINAAVNGDTVLVGPGVYQENISFSTKNISLISEFGRDVTSIVAALTNVHVISIEGGQDTTSCVNGFSISGTSNAFGIYVNEADPIISNCEVKNCSHPGGDGAGIYIRLSGGRITNCLVHHNQGGNTGGGIAASGRPGRRVTIAHNSIYSNSSLHGPGIGCPGVTNVDIFYNLIYENLGTEVQAAGIYITGSNCRIYNNTVVGNTKGIVLYTDVATDVRNNIVAQSSLDGFFLSTATSEYNCTWANGSNNNPGTNGINANPLFTNVTADSFQLQSSSPCINGGDPNPVYNDPDGSRNDMGALPFVSSNTRKEVPMEYPTIQAAIDAAINGDTVLVADGHYYERISFLGKAICVASNYLVDGDTMHINQTIIDGDTSVTPLESDTGSVVRFVNSENTASILCGFTLTGGTGTEQSTFGKLGSAVFVNDCRPKISYCRMLANGSFAIGGKGGYHQSDYGTFLGCRVFNNTGGAFNMRGYIAFDSCEFYANDGASAISDLTCRMDNCKVFDTFLSMPYQYGAEIYFTNCVIDSCSTEYTTGNHPLRFDVKDSKMRNCRVDGYYASVILEGDSVFNCNLDIGNDRSLSVKNSTLLDCNIGFWSPSGSKIENSHFNGKMVFFGTNGADLSVVRSTLTDFSLTSLSGGFSFYCDSSLIVTDGTGAFIKPEPQRSAHLSLNCSNVYGFNDNWLSGEFSDVILNQVTFSNPFFCDTASGDYRIKDSSPCAPANNSCGVLIGAYGIGCANVAPALTSASSAQAVSGLGFVYKAASMDSDGPATNYSFINRPSWLTANGDSVFGIPPLTDIDTSFVVIVSDGFLADSQLVTVEMTESPTISVLTTEGVAVAMNVVSHTPTFGWQYFDATGSYPQTQFEIAVGSDSDWTHAELWNPAPFNGNATSRQYAGAALVDGQTYWVRARVRNALIWSNWKQTSFRMNSVPSAPQLRLPGNNNIVASQFPNLTIRNPIDAESDSMFLTFEISADSFATSFFPFQAAPSNDSLTTVAVPVMLNENVRFWWRVKGSDYYEESAYSPIWSFWINSGNTAPSAFGLLSPPNAQSPALADNTPEFTWQPSFDFDPGDSVKFTLQLSIDASFSFASQIPGLTLPQYIPASPLEWGRRYWWRVKAEDKATGLTWSNEVFTFTIMRLGDPDGNGMVTISDAVFLINYIFAGGPAPNPLLSGDADCNGIVTISDAVYLINYIFAGGPAPCE